jgi:hypothetical protein
MRTKLLLALVIVFSSVCAFAQTSTKSETVTLTLSNVVDIALTSTAGNSFTFDDVTKYDAGIVNANASTLAVKSNRAWNVNVKAQTANFNKSGGTTDMPANVLAVKANASATYLPLSTTDQLLRTGTRGGNEGANTFAVDYRATPAYNYDAATYTLVVEYTISQQ